MAEKEIALIKSQIEKLHEKSFDLVGWKNQTLLFLNRIFGANHPVVKMISELKYDYSSWNLRDATGNEKSDDPVKMQAKEILEAAIMELEALGVPETQKPADVLWAVLEEELTGKEVKEIKEIITEKSKDNTDKIKKKLDSLDKEKLSQILSRIMIS